MAKFGRQVQSHVQVFWLPDLKEMRYMSAERVKTSITTHQSWARKSPPHQENVKFTHLVGLLDTNACKTIKQTRYYLRTFSCNPNINPYTLSGSRLGLLRDQENLAPLRNKRLRSQSPEISGKTPEGSDVKRPKRLVRQIPLEEVQRRLQNSSNSDQPLLFNGIAAALADIQQTLDSPHAVPGSETPKTPAPPYRQTLAPLVVSQNYMHRLVAERWDAEVRCCEEGRKAQLLEVQLAVHGITKLV
ncbi:uncharacterized protein F5891DRAFT_987853 [Suillus fuscotomentosus]|uniref:Uncharacterized protein n=1 Tax=Suillus fuscotomentosus TaxID=1912939 RepID=A0AAD4DPK1_9AGAM|nr:uncharacterized protein F5891DRAFT_987853 [Suillus fuscotomentosus]KAG1888442.1 hypothetical protein F5891DRAFT_987853 [Suillus fuscotomentosus]